MAKKKQTAPVSITISGDELMLHAALRDKNFIIKEASVKDDYCHYTQVLTKGIGEGDTHKVKGTGIVKSDMHEALGKLRVHMAIIDDVYLHSNIEIDDIEKFYNHDLTLLYNVTGFKMKGTEENESIAIIGSKYVTSAVGRIALETPDVLMEASSGYKWYNELKAAADLCRDEVAMYALGKCTKPETLEEEAGTTLAIAAPTTGKA